MVAILVERWLSDQLVNNTVNVTIGSQSEQFVILPDGSYNPQLGSTDRLSLNSGTYQLKLKDGTALSFNAVGNIATWRNPAGVTIGFTYNNAVIPQLTSVTNGLGHTLTLTYNNFNQLTVVTDETGRHINYGYDSSGDLVSFTDPAGNISRFSYALPNGFVVPVGGQSREASDGCRRGRAFQCGDTVHLQRQWPGCSPRLIPWGRSPKMPTIRSAIRSLKRWTVALRGT
jgi:YD repeat-containing protein